jgi:cell division protein FtsX
MMKQDPNFLRSAVHYYGLIFNNLISFALTILLLCLYNPLGRELPIIYGWPQKYHVICYTLVAGLVGFGALIGVVANIIRSINQNYFTRALNIWIGETKA